ncbi:hypothetical protein ES703_98105 [subsurface metagenome]
MDKSGFGCAIEKGSSGNIHSINLIAVDSYIEFIYPGGATAFSENGGSFASNGDVDKVLDQLIKPGGSGFNHRSP